MWCHNFVKVTGTSNQDPCDYLLFVFFRHLPYFIEDEVTSYSPKTKRINKRAERLHAVFKYAEPINMFVEG